MRRYAGRLGNPAAVRYRQEVRALDIADSINETCPSSGKPVQADSLTEYEGQVVGICNPGCRDKFDSAVRHFDAPKASQAAR